MNLLDVQFQPCQPRLLLLVAYSCSTVYPERFLFPMMIIVAPLSLWNCKDLYCNLISFQFCAELYLKASEKKKSDGLREDSVSSCRCRNMYINLSDNVRSDTIATSKLLILCIWIAIFDSSAPKFQILIVKRPCYFMLKYFKSCCVGLTCLHNRNNK